jgi:hypothetical protein
MPESWTKLVVCATSEEQIPVQSIDHFLMGEGIVRKLSTSYRGLVLPVSWWHSCRSACDDPLMPLINSSCFPEDPHVSLDA